MIGANNTHKTRKELRVISSFSIVIVALISFLSLPYHTVISFSTNALTNSHHKSACPVRQTFLKHGSSKNVIEPMSDEIKSSSPLDNSESVGNNKTDSGDNNNKSNAQQQSASPPPPALKNIADERREFELNVGKALDTLKSDYPKIFHSCPDFSIYHSSLEVKDPSGVTLKGINNYKNFFRVLRAMNSFFYCADMSSITFRLVYDWARGSIRVSWHAVLIPKHIYFGIRHPLYVDGVSIYETNRLGVIIQHRVEQLMLNGSPAALPDGIFHAVNTEAQGIPVLGLEISAATANTNLFKTTSSDSFNKESFDQRNSYRKKYGLKPLTPEEFLDVEAKTRILEQETESRRSLLKESAKQSLKKKKGGLFSLFVDTCESNFDCERPEVCCDLIVKKVCCASGLKVTNFGPTDMRGQPALIPVPARPDGSPGSTARY